MKSRQQITAQHVFSVWVLQFCPISHPHRFQPSKQFDNKFGNLFAVGTRKQSLPRHGNLEDGRPSICPALRESVPFLVNEADTGL